MLHTVKELASSALKHLQDVDVLEIDAMAAKDLREVVVSMEALHVVAELPLSSQGLAALEEVHDFVPPAAQAKEQESALQLMQSMFKTYEWWGPAQGDHAASFCSAARARHHGAEAPRVRSSSGSNGWRCRRI